MVESLKSQPEGVSAYGFQIAFYPRLAEVINENEHSLWYLFGTK